MGVDLLQRSLVTHFDLFADNDEGQSEGDHEMYSPVDPVMEAFEALLASVRDSTAALEMNTWREVDEAGPAFEAAVSFHEFDDDADHEAWLDAWRARFRDAIPTVQEYKDAFLSEQISHQVWIDFDMFQEFRDMNSDESVSDAD